MLPILTLSGTQRVKEGLKELKSQVLGETTEDRNVFIICHVIAVINGKQIIVSFQNIPEGVWVTRVEATDLDEGTNGIVEYDFIKNPASSPDWEKFSIDRRSGNITTADYIDREEQEVYFVSVTLLAQMYVCVDLHLYL